MRKDNLETRQKNKVKVWVFAYMMLLICGLAGCGKEEIVSHRVEQDGSAVESELENNTEDLNDLTLLLISSL